MTCREASLVWLQIHGCLLQAKVLLDINAQAVDAAALLDLVLPGLQSTTHLMHWGYPCAPIRNEATLLAAAVLALPGLPHTAAMKAFAHKISELCWQAILHSCVQSAQSSVDLASTDLLHDHQPQKALQDHERQLPRAERPLPYAERHLPHAGRHVQCDDADPMTSLWLKNAALLFFGQGLQQAKGDSLSDGQHTACALKEEEVQIAMQSMSYDVRAACLKSLIKTNAAGMSCCCLLQKPQMCIY